MIRESRSGAILWNKERTIAKNQNTFAKRQREMDKKAKSEAKRLRRNKRKQGLEETPPPQAERETPAEGDVPDHAD